MAALLIAATGVVRAGDLNVHIMLFGEVAPGVYGQVRIGDEPPPPVVYALPMLIVPQAAPPPPVYLHVPPGHAKNWRMHCREYNACNRPVYFIRSAEYEPGFDRANYEHEHDRANYDREHEHDRANYDGEHDRDRGDREYRREDHEQGDRERRRGDDGHDREHEHREDDR
jgi:hypothetical protein